MAWAAVKQKSEEYRLKEYAEIFDARGRDYHEVMLRYPHARDAEFEHILRLADLTDGQVLCDYPSGGGYLESYLKHDIDLVLLENSKVFLQCATEHSAAKRLLVQNYSIPMEDESADRFVSLAGLHHVDDKTVVFSEINRCLKKGGKFALADAYAGSGVAGFLNEFVDEYSDDGHEGVFLNASTKSELESCGFKVTYEQPIAYSWKFSSKTEMVEYCRLMFGVTKASPKQIEDAVRHYVGLTETGDGCEMGWELYFMVAEKKA